MDIAKAGARSVWPFATPQQQRRTNDDIDQATVPAGGTQMVLNVTPQRAYSVDTSVPFKNLSGG